MDIRLLVKDINLENRGNYFLFIQFEELKYPKKNKNSFKFRTEIKSETNSPIFNKNLFIFKNINLGSRITLKIGVYWCKSINTNITEKNLSKICVLYAYKNFTLTENFLNKLRRKLNFNFKLKLYDDALKEKGNIIFEIKLDVNSIKEKIIEDIWRCQKYYFDYKLDDKNKIKHNTEKIIDLVQNFNNEYIILNEKWKFLDLALYEIKNENFKLTGIKNKLQESNYLIKEELNNKNNVEEIGIHIDLLIGTIQGRNVLREKFIIVL